MERYIVSSTSAVLQVLIAYLKREPDRFNVIPQAVPSNGLPRDYIAIETTSEGAREIGELLQGIGSINPDKPLNGYDKYPHVV
jgi:hypothetical protein